jgi:hypothetical protein
MLLSKFHIEMNTNFKSSVYMYFLGHVNKVLVTTCLGSRGLGELFNLCIISKESNICIPLVDLMFYHLYFN